MTRLRVRHGSCDTVPRSRLVGEPAKDVVAHDAGHIQNNYANHSPAAALRTAFREVTTVLNIGTGRAGDGVD